ncbi:MAG: cupin domain-containing protein [Candidatus Ozemobacteraceae bacterium]
MIQVKNIKDVVPWNMKRLEIRELLGDKELDVTITHEILPPNTKHVEVFHERTCEFVYIIKGRATGKIDGQDVELNSGDFFFLPPRTAHKFETFEEGVEVISFFRPFVNMEKPDAIIA